MSTEENKAIVRRLIEDGFRGPLEGIPPTGRSVKVKDVDLYRLEHGKVVESWAHFDQPGMLQQLGVIGGGED